MLTLVVQTQFSLDVVEILGVAAAIGFLCLSWSKEQAENDSMDRCFILISFFISSTLVWTVASPFICGSGRCSAASPNLFDVSLFSFSVVLTCASLWGIKLGMMNEGKSTDEPVSLPCHSQT
jgi:hypothetical protein